MTAAVCIIAGVFLILGALDLIPLGRADRGTTTADRADWSPFDEPVPVRPAPFWTAEVSADYLLDDDPELERRFFAIVDSEDRWFA